MLPRLDARLLFFAGGLSAAAGLAWLAFLSPSTGLTWVILPGGAVGLALLGTIAAARTNASLEAPADALTSGYATALGVGAAIFLATAIVGAVFLPARIGATNMDSREGDRRRGRGPAAAEA